MTSLVSAFERIVAAAICAALFALVVVITITASLFALLVIALAGVVRLLQLCIAALWNTSKGPRNAN